MYYMSTDFEIDTQAVFLLERRLTDKQTDETECPTPRQVTRTKCGP